MNNVIIERRKDKEWIYDIIDKETGEIISSIDTSVISSIDIPVLGSLAFSPTPDEKHLKGYMFDSLVYRYKIAREKLAVYEEQEKRKRGECYDSVKYNANRDVMKFIEILNEAIGEHD